MNNPSVVVTYDNGMPRHLVYDNGNGKKVDLTEIMMISKIGWEYDVRRGVPMMTITFDAEMYSETE